MLRRLIVGDREEIPIPDQPERPNGATSANGFREMVWRMFDRQDKRMDRMDFRIKTSFCPETEQASVVSSRSHHLVFSLVFTFLGSLGSGHASVCSRPVLAELGLGHWFVDPAP